MTIEKNNLNITTEAQPQPNRGGKNMKNLIYLLILFLFSCSSHKATYDFYYEGQPNYKNFYVVDTIRIDDPVIVAYDGRFVCSRKLLDTLKVDKNFFERPDVFLLGQVGLHYDLDPADFDKYSYPDYGNCKIELKTTLKTRFKTKFKKKRINIRLEFYEQQVYLYEYETPPTFFILGLINANYYNNKHAAIDGPSYLIETKDQKTSYYKIVYPLCQ